MRIRIPMGKGKPARAGMEINLSPFSLMGCRARILINNGHADGIAHPIPAPAPLTSLAKSELYASTGMVPNTIPK